MKISEEIPKIMSDNYRMKQESESNKARYEFEKKRFEKRIKELVKKS